MVLIFDLLSWVLLVAGSLTLVLSAVGIVRMPTFYTRLHVASINETLGPGLILLGLAFQAVDRPETAIKLGLVLIFLVLTGPIASHALAKAALENGIMPSGTQRLRDSDMDESA